MDQITSSGAEKKTSKAELHNVYHPLHEFSLLSIPPSVTRRNASIDLLSSFAFLVILFFYFILFFLLFQLSGPTGQTSSRSRLMRVQ